MRILKVRPPTTATGGGSSRGGDFGLVCRAGQGRRGGTGSFGFKLPDRVPDLGSTASVHAFVLATSTAVVTGYNEYPALGVEVREVYCGGCDLFLGHQFDDGVAKGDTGPGAGWRH